MYLLKYKPIYIIGFLMHLPFYILADTNNTQPDVPSFSFHYKGETLHCEPQKLLRVKIVETS